MQENYLKTVPRSKHPLQFIVPSSPFHIKPYSFKAGQIAQRKKAQHIAHSQDHLTCWEEFTRPVASRAVSAVVYSRTRAVLGNGEATHQILCPVTFHLHLVGVQLKGFYNFKLVLSQAVREIWTKWHVCPISQSAVQRLQIACFSNPFFLSQQILLHPIPSGGSQIPSSCPS